MLEFFCRLGLGQRCRPPAFREPTAAVDYYFLGVLHAWVHGHREDALSTFVFKHALPGIDFDTPLATSELYLRKAVALEPHYWSYLWLGITLKLANKPEAAIGAFNTCVALRPDYPLGHAYRGHTLALLAWQCFDPRLRDHCVKGAARDLKETVDLSPDYVRASNELGNLYYTTSRHDLAVAQYDEAIRRSPTNPLYYSNRGASRLQAGSYRSAIDDFTTALRLDANPDPASAVRFDSTDWGAWRRAALGRLGRGDRDGYRQACARIVQCLGRPEDHATANAAAWTCVLAPASLADSAWAVRMAETAVGRAPNNGTYLTTLGAALYRSGDFKRAARRLSEAVTSHGQGGTALDCILLAMTYHRLGDGPNSRTWLERAISKKPINHSAGHPLSWGDLPPDRWLEIHVLLREAAALFQEPSCQLAAALAPQGALHAAVMASIIAEDRGGR
jgi:tetratricopeptide (TPR) repeat protein